MAAYGRLDVFWPDGLFKTYSLADSTVSIGRSSGNTIALDTDTLSRYHACLNYTDGQVTLTDLDSANGTFVDSVKLNGNEPRVLYGGEEISIGELRMIYHLLDDTPTRPITVPEETTQRIEIEEAPFFIELEEPSQAIPPGAHISARLSITNTGDQPERFRVEISGIAKDWARMDRPELEIAPEQTGDVIINFKPRRRSDSAPGAYAVIVNVYLKNKPELALKAGLTLHVLPFGGFGMALERNRLKPRERFRLHLHNQGSAPLPLNLIVRDLGDSLTIALPNNHLTLAPGQHTVVQGQATPQKSSFFGDPHEHVFDVIARSGDAAAFTIASRAYVDEKPPLPGWAAFALGGGALAVIVIILIGLGVLLQPPPPQPAIGSFQVSSTRVAQGKPLTLNWSVTDAQQIQITIDGTEVYNQTDLQTHSYDVDTAALDGTVTIDLIASNSGRETQASETVQVFKPIAVSTFTVTPQQLVLYVAQNLTISWNVDGATAVRLSGLENFTDTPLNSAYAPTGSVSVVGIPTGTITVTLTAQNEDTSIQQPITIDLISPQCTATQGDVLLYAAPDTAEQVVATISQGTTVTVDAQDAYSQWLRVQLSGGAHGWGQRTGFTCAKNFSVDDLYKELIVPTARPEFTVVPTLAPAVIAGTPATAAPPPTAQPTNSG